MDVMRGEGEEKRVILLSLDELQRLAGESVGHSFILPARRLPAAHPADAAHAVYDGHIMPVGMLEPEQLRILRARRLLAALALVTHLDRIGGIEPDHAMVLNVNRGHAVARR